MIRDLRLIDVPLQFLPGHLSAQNLVTTRDEISGTPHRLSPLQLARWSLSLRNQEHCLASDHNTRLNALAVVRPRQGPKSWEIAHLFTVDGANTALTDLLERSVGFVASQSGERLFLRVVLNGSVQKLAEQTGFRRLYTEDIFTLHRPMPRIPDRPLLNVRPPLSADSYEIFRLYNATHSPEARASMGLTLEQWHDSRERSIGRVREYVWIHQERIHGWFSLNHHRTSLTLEAVLHPDEVEEAGPLVSYVAHLAWGHDYPSWIVPDHQPAIGSALVEQGWQHSRRYAVMARAVGRTVTEPGLAPVRA